MTKLNPFRLSFDKPLASGERARARVSATLVGGAALFLGVSAGLALLNASSATIGSWANGQPDATVRVVDAEADVSSGKPCEEQTWPYLEARCLKRADSTDRSVPRHGLSANQIQLQGAKSAETAPVSITAPERSTTGSAPSADQEDRTAEVSPNQAAPAAKEPVRKADPAAETAPRRLTQSELDRVTRERARVKRDRQREARKLSAEARRARAEARDARRARAEERAARNWSDYGYASEGRLVRRGSLNDGFFPFR